MDILISLTLVTISQRASKHHVAHPFLSHSSWWLDLNRHIHRTHPERLTSPPVISSVVWAGYPHSPGWPASALTTHYPGDPINHRVQLSSIHTASQYNKLPPPSTQKTHWAVPKHGLCYISQCQCCHMPQLNEYAKVPFQMNTSCSHLQIALQWCWEQQWERK